MRKSMSVATKAAELAIAVPQVVAHRVARLATAGPSPSESDRREFQRMTYEKVSAFQQSWNAMAMQAFRANQALAASLVRAFWAPALSGRPSANGVAVQLQGAALAVLDQGLAPVHRKAVANAKRLARTKLR
jgi:hypothetical protein